MHFHPGYTRANGAPRVFLFGSLPLSFDHSEFRRIQNAISGDDRLSWILDVISDLPDAWQAVATALGVPGDRLVNGYRQLVDVKDAFNAGVGLMTPYPLPNKLLVPLATVDQLIQYMNFNKNVYAGQDNTVDWISRAASNGETLGFCTGLLSAAVASSSKSSADFERYAASAVRLAVAIGAIADMDATGSARMAQQTRCLGTEWTSESKLSDLRRFIDSRDDTYISVKYDYNRATVTTSAAAMAQVQQYMRSAGLPASEIGLRGRYHSQEHAEAFKALAELCNERPEFQFCDCSDLGMKSRSDSGGQYFTSGPLHHHVLRSILLEPPNWHRTLKRLEVEVLSRDATVYMVAFGPERPLPPSLSPSLGSRCIHVSGSKDTHSTNMRQGRPEGVYPDTDIAVVGMSCKVAGADDLEEFWEVLSSGESQHEEVPPDRFTFETAFRDADPKRKWFGNFIRGHDAFDNKFFKISPREAATTDPQQRQLLQVAYQAVEQSGYFRGNGSESSREVGCYIGLCGTDYENNIACHAPNAFCATGNLEGFAAGKVSHYFGWTGPALVVDTACSSSAVAIHQACQAILSGECRAALAGGTHVMTSPHRFQNLAGASFLSTTGQCKPFDSKADGYCRGDGVAAIFLKKLSAAVADGDEVLGVIAATRVRQNRNCTPIFVPNSPSLSGLFRDVSARAKLEPEAITVVEAHGTGTAVGDPAEYEGVRQALGGANRSNSLALGSVKGCVGHTEPTSGVLSLIKVLLMMNKGLIPPQASFKTINPNVNAQACDKIVIPTSLKPWDASFKAALINNYGASGSNASVVLTQGPAKLPRAARHESSGSRYPFWLCGLDGSSISRYAAALVKYINHRKGSTADFTLGDMSFNLARKTNRSLPRSLIFSVESLGELSQALSSVAGNKDGSSSSATRSKRPVVFCFGGQVSTFVGLDRELYGRVKLLRQHLGAVDAAAERLGAGSILPDIFQREPIKDTVKLQTVLFAMQYASARCWIDSGLEPVALVGHSFGELTALCVSGILTLEDCLKAVMRRATLVRDCWGPEKGAMMAVEADLETVQDVLRRAAASPASTGSDPASIACYNGSRSFTLAGSVEAVDAVAEVVEAEPPKTIRCKRLNVTNSFHCSLVDNIDAQLRECGLGLCFRKPAIRVEHASEQPLEQVTVNFFAEHLRSPVFFDRALRRITKRHPSCVFLEAGSNSTVTHMAGRALGSNEGLHFQGLSITGEPGTAWNNLVDCTLSLWKEGVDAAFWSHHGCHLLSHESLLLPPYQFEQAKHWMELKTPQKAAPEASQSHGPDEDEDEDCLFRFAGYTDDKKQAVRFRINTSSSKYKRLVSGHIFAETAAICPATVQLDVVIEAIRSLDEPLASEERQPQLLNIQCQLPVCVDASRGLWVDFKKGSDDLWTFSIVSTEASSRAAEKGSSVHTTGTLRFVPADDSAAELEFSRLERLVGSQRCLELLNSGDVDEVLLNKSIYKIFADTVSYTEDYRGVRKLVSRGNQCAALVVRQHDATTWLDARLADCLCQVAGIWANCMTDCSSADMYVCNGMQHWLRSPSRSGGKDDCCRRPASLHVLAVHHFPSEKAILSDIFAFDANTNHLVEVITGISYVKVSRASMSKVLARLTPGLAAAEQLSTASNPGAATSLDTADETQIHAVARPSRAQACVDSSVKAPDTSGASTISSRLRKIISELSGVDEGEIHADSALADVGIDSLLGMELAHEVDSAFKINIPEATLTEIADFPGLLNAVAELLGRPSELDAGGDDGGPEQIASSSTSEYGDRSNSECSGFQTGVSTPAMSEPETPAELSLPHEPVLQIFKAVKETTDDRIVGHGQQNYATVAEPLQTELCISLTLDALDELGCSVRDSPAGSSVDRVPHPAQHSRLVDALYAMLDKEGKLVTVGQDGITRTGTPCPVESSQEILQRLLSRFPDQRVADELTYYAGSRLADVLRGETNGVKLIFGCSQGRDLVSRFYAEWPLHKLLYGQLQDFVRGLAEHVKAANGGPLKILEMGAGTGGTTRLLLPVLAEVNQPVEYTFTDLAPSFVAAARKTFKDYPFVRFRQHDISNPPPEDLAGTQHLIIASNAVHATPNLKTSTGNMRRALREDGMLLLVEMTGRVWWMDLVFGLFEGWWLFDDGREYVVQDERRWERDLQSVGYGIVDWTDGVRPENKLERLIIASASRFNNRCASLPTPPPCVKSPSADCAARAAAVRGYVQDLGKGFVESLDMGAPRGGQGRDGSRTNARQGHGKKKCVLISGGTGSLGAHVVANAALRSDVSQVVCLNKKRQLDGTLRQKQSMLDKGLNLPREALDKLRVLETDLSRPLLGLSEADYHSLTVSVTHIVHNAWLMNTKWPLKRFEPQLRIMRNMTHLARDISLSASRTERVSFQLVSSVAAVGHWPVCAGKATVPEDRVAVDAVLPIGYGDAKHVCEKLLDQTLHLCPDRFRVTVVRPGQIAGSTGSGYWNTREHVPFLIKSSQTLGILPDLPGHLAWAPVDAVAGAAVDILTLPDTVQAHPVYHIDNPSRQSWSEMISMLRKALGIPRHNVVPFADWIKAVRINAQRNNGPDGENPASMLADFFEHDFVHMSCGVMVLGTDKACEHSATLRNLGPVTEALLGSYIRAWQKVGFLRR
ncbi:Beta-ketoacyl synthase [Metarhizium album ARSEF 1941]|uniref:Beta-ketoacyl synthase n=1 Tax=Metarhizium album (strain ARSEF 1941) TaxID=1081103 RepID=A0A0B2WX74_METAS|nr:Beta-ketoacyl synthase [Metarhizium album ARSEF 1941]KHN98032.1 Beta-ketoacyl synthase [Metarhizium album ARSEF 1941]